MEYDHTYPGLMHWYSSLFAKFGWVAALHGGDSEKINCYLRTVHDFKKATKKAAGDLPPDKKHQLEIMNTNIGHLHTAIEKIFPNEVAEFKQKKTAEVKNESSPATEAAVAESPKEVKPLAGGKRQKAIRKTTRRKSRRSRK